MELEPAERLDRLKAFVVDAVLLGGVGALRLLGVPGWLAAWGQLLIVLGQWTLLARRGQTVGKGMFAVKIVRVDTGENGGFLWNVLVRSVLNWTLGFIPLYLLADSLFIFRSDRRCLHDLMAGTVVVKA